MISPTKDAYEFAICKDVAKNVAYQLKYNSKW